jgi:hypothetical protein
VGVRLVCVLRVILGGFQLCERINLPVVLIRLARSLFESSPASNSKIDFSIIYGTVLNLGGVDVA